ncbi:geranylgeranyl diphosphate reductase [Rubritepida flocculans]|uniref:geranylgeranyl diphosphate reductase n=1 Tax=Rubritepida flocculans TaxID=182403 RepID=UPI001FE0928A|nr:geranylgeranyl diphosphate reductase [Rubritepida flocculans]
MVGGGPAGATAADDLARAGLSVAMLDRAGRIKPCGGAIPPRAIRDFAIPDHLLKAKITCADIVSPKGRRVPMPVENGFVGMVDRCEFDEWLRQRAAASGAQRLTGEAERLERDADGLAVIAYRSKAGAPARVRARFVILANGARSELARQAIPSQDHPRCVFAYHEIVKAPAPGAPGVTYEATRCDVIYDGRTSPDFYAWIFPHGETASIGTGSARKGFGLRPATAEVRRRMGLDAAETIRREGAPIPMKPLKRWDNGRDVVLAGDTAGVVAPASGEGIYYAMLGGRLAAEAVREALASGDARALATARQRFMKDHGKVFWILGIMQTFWYRNDWTREHFVKMCEDKDVQRLTWESYMNKELVRRDPLAHVKIFFKDMAHLLGLARA